MPKIKNTRFFNKKSPSSDGQSCFGVLSRFPLFTFLLSFIFALTFSSTCTCASLTELGSQGDLVVLGTGGTAVDPNIKIKGFTVFGSTQTTYTGAVVGDGNVVINGVLAVSSGAYFVGNSTFTAAGNIFINDGMPDQVLASRGPGLSLKWTAISALGDDLGDHVATTTLNMNNFGIINAASGTFTNGVTASSATLTNTAGAGLFVSSSAYLAVSGGNVGIGTTGPSEKLHVSGGNIRIDNMTTAGFVKNSATGVLTGGQGMAAGDVPTSNLVNGTGISMAGTLTSRVVGSGNNVTVAVAASVPTSVTNGTNVTGSIASNVLTLGWTGQLGVAGGGTGASTLTGMLKGAGAGAITGITGTPNYIPKWSDANTLSGTSSIYDNGNVGIGTTSPGAALDVKAAVGDTYAVNVSSNNGTGLLAVQQDGTVKAGDTSGANYRLELNHDGNVTIILGQ